MTRQFPLIILTYFSAIIFFTACSLRTSDDSREVRMVVADKQGRQWAATKNGLYRQDFDGVFVQMPLPSLTHHPYPSIYAMAVDTVNRRLWVGAWNHLYCYDLTRERFVTTADSAICRTVSLFCDSVGRVIALTEHGQFRYTLNDTLPQGLTEQMDSVRYPKPTLSHIDTSEWTFGNTERNRSNSLTLIIAIVAILALATTGWHIMVKKSRKGNEYKRNKETADSDYICGDIASALPQKISFLERAGQVVDAHMNDEDFSIDTFSQEMAVSRAQLFRKLKSANGQTVKEFINARRMAHAASLLTTTKRTISDIAEEVGFSDASNFSRCFVKNYGMPPSEYREKNQK